MAETASPIGIANLLVFSASPPFALAPLDIVLESWHQSQSSRLGTYALLSSLIGLSLPHKY